MKSKSIWLLGFLIVAAPLLIAGGWADICTNLLGIRLDPVTVPHATNGQVIAYRSVDNTYVATSAGGGGGGGVTAFVPGAGISGAIVGTTLGVSNTGVLSVTAGANVTIGGTASAPVINASASGSGVNGTVNGAGSTALTTVNVTGTLLGSKSSISGSTLNVSLDLIATGDVAAANKDGLAAVPSMRTLGTGAQQSPPGNDARFPPAPSNANNIVRDTGTAYATVTAGGNSTALTVSSGGALGFSQITNAMILNAAGIPYSKLTLTASILVGDLANKTGTGTNVVTDAGASIGTPNFVFGSDAAGDIPVRGASTYGVLAKGSNNTVLRINSSGVQQYGAVTDAMLVSVFVNTADTRVLPTPSGAGKTVYDNGTNYVALATGTSSQLYRGGSAPTWGAAPLAALQEVLATTDLTDVSGTTGSGSTLPFATGPTLTTPILAGTPSGAGGIGYSSSDFIGFNTGARKFLDDEFHAVLQTFVAAGTSTYTPTTNTVWTWIRCVGGGGGSGGATGSATSIVGTAGGGAGGYSEKWIVGPTAQTVVIGAAGAAGAAGSGGTGGSGGNTTFGSTIIVANGGAGSGGAGIAAMTAQASGGAAGTGDIAVAGQPGEKGNVSTSVVIVAGGSGGSCLFGAGGTGATATTGSTTAGTSGKGNGSGAGGCCSYNTATTVAGGAGAPGALFALDYVRR